MTGYVNITKNAGVVQMVESINGLDTYRWITTFVSIKVDQVLGFYSLNVAFLTGR